MVSTLPSISVFVNGRILRGSLLVAIFLVLLYFVILNVLYFLPKNNEMGYFA